MKRIRLTDEEIRNIHINHIYREWHENDMAYLRKQDKAQLKKVAEWLNTKIGKLNHRIKELERLRKPLITKIPDENYTVEEVQFMLSSIDEIIQSKKIIGKLDELRQALLKEIDDD